MSAPPGARCSRHAEDDASAICARCGDFLCGKCAISMDGAAHCSRCASIGEASFPWERRSKLGVVRAFFDTLKVSIAEPEGFAGGFRDRPIGRALAFAMCIVVPLGLARHIPEIWWPTATTLRSAAEPFPLGGTSYWLNSDAFHLGMALGAPLIFLLAIYVEGAAWWLGLRIMGAVRPIAHVVAAIAYVRAALTPLAMAAFLPEPYDRLSALGIAMFTLVVEARALRSLSHTTPLRMAGAASAMVLAAVALLCLLSFVASLFLLAAGAVP
jgi:hypothetical protein